MIKQLLQYLGFGHQPEAAVAGAAPVPLRQISEFLSPGPPLVDGDPANPVPRWPEHGAAMAAVAPALLLETQREILGAIRASSPLSPAQFDALLMPVFERYAAWVHLLPASESHHHSGPGGLLAHGLEVSMHAARIADGKTVGVELAPSERARYEPRWRVAAMLGALCHDLGKPLLDVGASDPDRRMQWPAHAGPLYDWLQANQMSHYRFYWRPGQRHERHKLMGSTIVREVVGPQLLAWLSDEPTQEVIELMELSIAQGKTSGNLMSQIISQADSMSVEADLRRLAERTRGTGQGANNHVAALILGELRALVEGGALPINQEGKPLWWTQEGLFGLYPAILDEVIPKLSAKKIGGMSASRNEIARLLGETGFLECAQGETADGNVARSDIWHLALKVGRKDAMMEVPALPALRFSKPEYVVGALPLPAPVEGTAKPPFMTAQSIEDAVSGIRQVGGETPEAAPKDADPENTGAPTPTPAPESAPAPTPQAAPEAVPPTEPYIESRRNRGDLAQSVEIERKREAAAEARKGQDDYKTLAARITRVGPVGAAVVHVLRRLALGKLTWDTDACMAFDGLAVRFPEAFETTGIPAADLLAACASEGWLAMEGGGDRKVQDVQFPDGQRKKSVVFTGLVRRAWEALEREGPGALGATQAKAATSAPPQTPAVDQAPAATPKAATAPAADNSKAQSREEAPQPVQGSRGQQRNTDRPAQGRASSPPPASASAQPDASRADRRPQSQAPSRSPPHTPVARAPAGEALEMATQVSSRPRNESLACRSMAELTPERALSIRGVAWAGLQIRLKPGQTQADLDSETIRDAMRQYASNVGIASAVLGAALCSEPNALIRSSIGQVNDFLTAPDLSINPDYLAPDWAEGIVKGSRQ